MQISNYLIKPLLALAVAVPMMATVGVDDANAHRKHYRGAAIAGAIIGGALVYHHYRKHRKHRYYRHYGYPRYGVRYRKHRYHRHRQYHRHHHGHGYYYGRYYGTPRFQGVFD